MATGSLQALGRPKSAAYRSRHDNSLIPSGRPRDGTATAAGDDPLDPIREMVLAESLDRAGELWDQVDVQALRRLARAGGHGAVAMSLARELAENPALKVREARGLLSAAMSLLASVALGEHGEIKRGPKKAG